MVVIGEVLFGQCQHSFLMQYRQERPAQGECANRSTITKFFVDLKLKKYWRPVFRRDKEELISAMDRELSKIPGVLWNFPQPISDNMEEAVSGVKGELAVKLYGEDNVADVQDAVETAIDGKAVS
jgi:Cu/Ag efflux pump CusA